MYAGLGLMLMGARSAPAAGLAWAPLFLLGGGVIFSGTVFALALGAPRWFGAITPIGGMGMTLGFLAFAWQSFRG